MTGYVDRRKMGMPPAGVASIAKNGGIASGSLCCETGHPPARAGGVSF
jgi:hypothetical protein